MEGLVEAYPQLKLRVKEVTKLEHYYIPYYCISGYLEGKLVESQSSLKFLKETLDSYRSNTKEEKSWRTYIYYNNSTNEVELIYYYSIDKNEDKKACIKCNGYFNLYNFIDYDETVKVIEELINVWKKIN
jgi:hypothetical protein